VAARVAPGRYMLVATISAVAWAAAWTGAGYALYHVTTAVGPASRGRDVHARHPRDCLRRLRAEALAAGTAAGTCALKELALTSDNTGPVG
jgi:hypothetical protein